MGADIRKLAGILKKSRAIQDKVESGDFTSSGMEITPQNTDNYLNESQVDRPQQTMVNTQDPRSIYRNLEKSKMPKEILEAMVNEPLIPQMVNNIGLSEDLIKEINPDYGQINEEKRMPTIEERSTKQRRKPAPKQQGVNANDIRQLVREEIKGVFEEVMKEYIDKRLINESIQIKIGNTIFSGDLKPIPGKKRRK
jgi:hypothetical protein